MVNKIALIIIGVCMIGFGVFRIDDPEHHSTAGYVLNFGEHHALIGTGFIIIGILVIYIALGSNKID